MTFRLRLCHSASMVPVNWMAELSEIWAADDTAFAIMGADGTRH